MISRFMPDQAQKLTASYLEKVAIVMTRTELASVEVAGRDALKQILE